MYEKSNKIKCFLCTKIADILDSQDTVRYLSCDNCGEYAITIEAERIIELNNYENIKYILSSQTFENYYYQKQPLIITKGIIEKASDISLLEKMYKLSRFTYQETKEKGMGAIIKDAKPSRFYCKTEKEYRSILEVLKGKQIIENVKNITRIADDPLLAYAPIFTGKAMLAFEKGINTPEEFEEAFNTMENTRNIIVKDNAGSSIQVNAISGGSIVNTVQNARINAPELQTMFEKLLQSIPVDLNKDKREEIHENIDIIKTEIQSAKPRESIIKNSFHAMKILVNTIQFIAALTAIAAYLGITI